MTFLENKIPPPIIALVIGFVMWWLSPGLPTLNLDSSIIKNVATLVFVAGALLAVVGVLEFLKRKTTVNPHHPEKTTTLVVSGVFKFSRNPMYVGMALALLAIVIYLQSPLLLAGPALFVLFINRFQIAPEERAMEHLFGAEFEQYKQQVRRWL